MANSMEHTLRVIYDEAILKRGVAAFIWQRLCKGFGYLGLAALLLMVPSLWLAEGFGWFQIFLIVVLTGVALVIALAYWANLRLKLFRFRQMKSPEVAMTLREDGFEVTSSLGTAIQNWSYLTGVLKRPDFWLLFGPKAEFIVLPLRGLSHKALQYLEQKVNAAS